MKCEEHRGLRRAVLSLWKEQPGRWRHQCHVAAMAIVNAGLADRVARGSCRGVGGQHSWAVIGDPYAPDLVIDATLWSYREDVKSIYVGSPDRFGHRPHGAGSIWAWGHPKPATGPRIKLTPKTPLSVAAREFLAMIEPLDRAGWSVLAHAPVGGWPSGEVFAAMDDTPALAQIVPIDILGMTTNRNPGGLYQRTA